MLEILISRDNKERKIALLENGKLIEYYVDEEESIRKEGNIYIGIVKDIVKGMQSAFVDIGTEKNSFIHLKDILDKIDESKENINPKIDISDIIKTGQKLLVQVKKDSNLQKGARVSTHINLPSKYIGKEQEIIEDIKNIEAKWEKIEISFKNDKGNKPKLIAKSENIVEKMLIDLPENSIQKITINNKKDYEKMLEFKEKKSYLKSATIELIEDQDILDKYDIEKEISKLENRKIWLKCGGFITIDRTEALTAIDVNTGKYTGTKNVEQTIYKVNEEATIEIAKQLRLRDIGGIIIIDYIDMKDEKNKEKIETLLKEKLKN